MLRSPTPENPRDIHHPRRFGTPLFNRYTLQTEIALSRRKQAATKISIGTLSGVFGPLGLRPSRLAPRPSSLTPRHLAVAVPAELMLPSTLEPRLTLGAPWQNVSSFPISAIFSPKPMRRSPATSLQELPPARSRSASPPSASSPT